jgi:hypothetical protein
MEKQILLNNQIVLCKEIFENESILQQAGISKERINSIIAEARQLCKE